MTGHSAIRKTEPVILFKIGYEGRVGLNGGGALETMTSNDLGLFPAIHDSPETG